MEWEIKEYAKSFKPGDKFCFLCNAEKTAILLADRNIALNKLSEFIAKCRHKNASSLNNVKTVKSNKNNAVATNIVNNSRSNPDEEGTTGNKTTLPVTKSKLTMTTMVKIKKLNLNPTLQLKRVKTANDEPEPRRSQRRLKSSQKYKSDEWVT